MRLVGILIEGLGVLYVYPKFSKKQIQSGLTEDNDEVVAKGCLSPFPRKGL